MYKIYLNLFNKSLSSLNPLFSSMSLRKMWIKIDINGVQSKYLFKYALYIRNNKIPFHSNISQLFH